MVAVQAAIAQYGQDQNDLSAPENLGSGTILGGNSYATAYECLYDGLIFITRSNSQGWDGTLWFSSTESMNIGIDVSTNDSFCQIFVSKGNRIYIGGSTNGVIKAQWYKNRDYSSRS